MVDNWRKQTAVRVSQYDWGKVIADAYPFVERQNDLQMLNRQNVIKLLEIRLLVVLCL